MQRNDGEDDNDDDDGHDDGDHIQGDDDGDHVQGDVDNKLTVMTMIALMIIQMTSLRKTTTASNTFEKNDESKEDDPDYAAT